MMLISNNLLLIYCTYATLVNVNNGEDYNEAAIMNTLFAGDSSDSKESQESVDEEHPPLSLNDLVRQPTTALCNQSVLDEFGDDTHVRRCNLITQRNCS
jgi:hypothetical protein